MRRSRRRLEPGPDGMADVIILTNPIPRAVSLVPMGANDRVATSWKSADQPEETLRAQPTVHEGTLRSPPVASVVTRASADASAVLEFVDETLSAWREVVVAVLDRPLSAEERSAQVLGATSQAAARVAALAHALKDTIAAVMRDVAFTPTSPSPPTDPTFEGQVERSRFITAVDASVPFMRGSIVEILRSSAGTEAIMSVFADVGVFLAEWASEIKDGVVGVAQKAGARHSKADKERLAKLRELLGELFPEELAEPAEPQPEQTTESVMTIEQLKALALGDPLGFLGAIDAALKVAKEKNPVEAKKFAWGETGVEPESTDAILAQLRTFLSGDQLLGAILGAVGGVDVDAAGGSGATPQVAASMKSANDLMDQFERVVAATIKARPTGLLANQVRLLVAPSVAEAITTTLKAYLDGENRPHNPAGALDFSNSDEELDDAALQALLQPGFPSLNRPAAR